MAEGQGSKQGPIEIRSIALNLTPDVGADDVLVAVRLIPNGRHGNVVLARSLRPDEKDDDTPVVVSPAIGERLEIPPGDFQISIRDVDRSAKAGLHGYATITNKIST